MIENNQDLIQESSISGTISAVAAMFKIMNTSFDRVVCRVHEKQYGNDITPDYTMI